MRDHEFNRNEEKLIKPTLENVPEVIDQVYVVDDVSPDNQNEVILKYGTHPYPKGKNKRYDSGNDIIINIQSQLELL